MLAVLGCAVVAPQVPGHFQGLVRVGASQGETALAAVTPSALEAPRGSPVSASALPRGWISTLEFSGSLGYTRSGKY